MWAQTVKARSRPPQVAVVPHRWRCGWPTAGPLPAAAAAAEDADSPAKTGKAAARASRAQAGVVRQGPRARQKAARAGSDDGQTDAVLPVLGDGTADPTLPYIDTPEVDAPDRPDLQDDPPPHWDADDVLDTDPDQPLQPDQTLLMTSSGAMRRPARSTRSRWWLRPCAAAILPRSPRHPSPTHRPTRPTKVTKTPALGVVAAVWGRAPKNAPPVPPVPRTPRIMW